jgi:hypothetical protein
MTDCSVGVALIQWTRFALNSLGRCLIPIDGGGLFRNRLI